MYEQLGIFGESDVEFAERTAIALIKAFEPVAMFHFDKSVDVKNTDMCYTNKYFIVNPMAQWSTAVRDKYIAKHNIEVNPIYEKYGLKRCGCIMCPMCSDKCVATKKGKKRQ